MDGEVSRSDSETVTFNSLLGRHKTIKFIFRHIDRSLELHMERGELINYLAKRLDWSRQTTNQIQKSFRRLKNYNGRCRNVMNDDD